MVSTRRSSRLQRGTPQPPGSFCRDSTMPQLDETPLKPTNTNENFMPATAETVGSPRTSSNPFSSLLSKLTRTPKQKVSILPTHAEMHPSQHQQSTTKPNEDARWLGMMPMTEPAKKSQIEIMSESEALAVAQATPTRTSQSAKAAAFYTPPAELRLTSKRKASFDAQLSPEAQRIMAQTREEAAKIRAKMTAAKERQEAQDQHAEHLPVFGLTDNLGSRKIAKPRGRFSDAHKKAFGNMDSIANHPSVSRAGTVSDTTSVPLKDAEPQSSKQLKRTHSKTDLNTPQKSNLPVKTAFTPIPPRDPAFLSPAKRLKKVNDTDTSTACPSMSIGTGFPQPSTPTVPASASTTRIKTGIPLPRSQPGTLTKASLARSQSAKTLRHTTSIPNLAKSPSLKTMQRPALATPVAVATAAKEHVPALAVAMADDTATPSELISPLKLTRSPSVRSILRSGPKLLYSDDPSKIAAGTHIPTPKRKSLMPRGPATAPVKKHVDFTESTKSRAGRSELQSSPSPEEVAEIVEDRTHAQQSQASQDTVSYPSLDVSSKAPSADTTSAIRPMAIPKSKLNRRQTADPGVVSSGISTPGNFTFRASGAPSFASPTKSSTIRKVRNSDIPAPLSSTPSDSVTVSKKRKLEKVTEDAEHLDKENLSFIDVVEEEQRPAKKVKAASEHAKPAPSPEKPAGTAAQKAGKKGPLSRLPALSSAASSAARKGGLTMARLNMLAMPKKKRT